jgi:hypothetical protein
MPSISELSTLAKRELDFLQADGWAFESEKILAPEYYRGGFILHFRRTASELIVEYLEMEFAVKLDGREIFGPQQHPEFSGNVFSREHFAEHLSKLADVVANELAAERRRGV